MTARGDRKYDITLFGATGFTGRLAAQYLAKQYGATSLKWAIAGRSASKLDAIKKECDGLPDIVVADSGNKGEIRAMVAQTKVVITTAGPFARYGTPVVEACAELGTDYCDITGESPWVRDMIGLYDSKAKSSGARIVHHCGHDCVPWDLMVLMLTLKLREQNKEEQLQRVELYDDLKGTFSGGTLETAVGLFFGPEAKAKPLVNLGYDPLLKDGEGKSSCKTTAANVACVTKGTGGKPHRTMFFMAGVNANAVKRSNALLKYGESIVYSEGSNANGLCGAYMFMAGMGLAGCLMACPMTRPCLRACLPKPGEGPSEEKMNSGHLTVVGVATGKSGGKAEAKIYFPTDPGYRDTARMLVESGLTFVLEDDFKCDGGVYTPAACQGESLLKRLVATGSTFDYV